MKHTPTLHDEIPLGSRVIVPASYCSTEPVSGRVVGIASIHVIFQYIVLLDTPIESEYGLNEAISVPGTLLRPEPIDEG